MTNTVDHRVYSRNVLDPQQRQTADRPIYYYPVLYDRFLLPFQDSRGVCRYEPIIMLWDTHEFLRETSNWIAANALTYDRGLRYDA